MQKNVRWPTVCCCYGECCPHQPTQSKTLRETCCFTYRSAYFFTAKAASKNWAELPFIGVRFNGTALVSFSSLPADKHGVRDCRCLYGLMSEGKCIHV